MSKAKTNQKAKARPQAICPHCGGKNFFVHENSYSKAYSDETEPNEIIVHTQAGEISLVECANESCLGAKDGGLADITHEMLEFEFNFQ